MWVSRKRFDALEGRVRALERRSDPQFVVYVGDQHPDRWFITLAMKDVLRAVIDHLGLKLGVQLATPDQAVLVKKLAK